MRNMKSPIPLTETIEERSRRGMTYPGQASWGIGPNICGDCKFFRRRVDKGSCKKAKQLMHRQRVPRFPRLAASCRYFDPKPQRITQVSPDEKLLDLKLKKYHETPNAYQLGPEGEPGGKTWLPKSLVQDNHDGTWTLPEWLAIERGLENCLAD